MVLEVALIDVPAGSEVLFQDGYRQAKHALDDATGCQSVRMTHGVESPTRFVLLVEWESIADHEAFRASAAFGVWRAGVGPHFATPPLVEHFSDVD
jgi:heme-degrading monooxygenase HmoA